MLNFQDKNAARIIPAFIPPFHRTVNTVPVLNKVDFNSNARIYQASKSQNIQLDTFDFSSKRGWDDFYLQLDDNGDDSTLGKTSRGEVFEFEWHSSIPHDFIISEITESSKVLMVGTGNSRLPREIYDAHNGETTLVCMDYSKPCVDMLKSLHKEDCPNMYFVCGDAMEMSSTIQDTINLTDPDHQERGIFDFIVDKGLMDAMMCNEGCDLDRYFREVRSILKPGGKMILVSYKITSATRAYLESDAVGLDWILDITEKSNSRVSFSVGQLNNS